MSYSTAIKNIPETLQLRTGEDFNRWEWKQKSHISASCFGTLYKDIVLLCLIFRFLPNMEATPSAIKDIIFRLGLLLDLKKIDFGVNNALKKVLKRYCK